MPARIDETQPKCCTKCGVVKPATEFNRGSRRKDGTYGLKEICKTCHTAQTGKWRDNNPEKYLDIKRRFTLSRDARRRHDPIAMMKVKLWRSAGAARRGGFASCSATVNELLSSFNGRCHVCGVLEAECNQKLHMDHSHSDGHFRGWLCGKCNKAAGLLSDSVEVVLNLAEYLEKAGVTTDGQ